MKKLVAITLTALALTACAPRGDGSYSRSSLGALTGALVGGVVGSQFGGGSGQDWATVGGILYGTAVGSAWGDEVDRYELQSKTKYSDGVFEYLPDNTYKAWVNPNTGKTSAIRPLTTSTPTQAGEAPCRLFETTRAGIGGYGHSAIGMVCRDSYGRWRLMD